MVLKLPMLHGDRSYLQLHLPLCFGSLFTRNYDNEDELRFGVNTGMMYARNLPAQVRSLAMCMYAYLHIPYRVYTNTCCFSFHRREPSGLAL